MVTQFLQGDAQGFRGGWLVPPEKVDTVVSMMSAPASTAFR